MAVVLLAPAKINLFLQITGDRPDGYHDLKMLMQSVSLADRLTLSLRDTSEIVVECNNPQVPTDQRNLAYKAVLLLRQRFPELADRGVHIAITKQIPIGGGLAGGSGNGAAVLSGLNALCQLGLTNVELADLALQLGSDVPFCLSGGTAIATGRGEQLTPVANFPTLSLVIAKPKDTAVSTAWAYQTFRSQRLIERSPTNLDQLWHELLNGGKAEAIGSCLYNDLERVVLPQYTAIAQLKRQLASQSLGALMSGSGACVFAICADGDHAQHLAQSTISPDTEAWAVHSVAHGCRVLQIT
jgi:4-diphosphocytidyl-2-C-methyl-D-erythritol kinase